MSDDLTPAELAEITGKKRAATQAAVLAKRGVPFDFLVSSVRVARLVARAHGMLPEPTPVPQPRPIIRTQQKPAGLLQWEAERRAWSTRNDAYIAEFNAQWKAGAPDRIKAGRRAIKALRRAAERNQTPPWADLNAIREVYDKAVRLSRETGVLHHVDHEIPLRGKTVSGLHVHANLRVLPWRENLSKGNRFNPTSGGG